MNNEGSECYRFFQRSLPDFPFPIHVVEQDGNAFAACTGTHEHWRSEPLIIRFQTRQGQQDCMKLRALRSLENHVTGDVSFEGNLYILMHLKQYWNVSEISFLEKLRSLAENSAFQFISNAQVNVKSHYDLPQEVFDVYLDRKYASYSSGMFEQPHRLDLGQMLRQGNGEEDGFDSLEKAMWRKFKDAVDFIAPQPGETLLDVGCGYGGQLVVALENHPFGKVVGWTHSANQVRKGRQMLAPFPEHRWELHEGDYRLDQGVYDHISSTGMVSHVGPRGLIPYVQNIRKRIKTGGRYLHHALMCPWRTLALNFSCGVVFNKKYVWPGFHWFTLGEHIRALEMNGFSIRREVNLSDSYRKTTATWYERMMAQKDLCVDNMGEQTFRAWQLYLAGCSEGFHLGELEVHRLYCVAL
jgi:cyclopropane-fatty-acyl-phospholipid synthase